jgi:hypothetical protein
MQNKDLNGTPGTYCTTRACIRDGSAGHPTAARFEVGPGDVPNFGGDERSEVAVEGAYLVQEGDETWYRWSSRFGDAGGTFPEAAGWGLIFMQWHSESGSPPLSLHAEGGQISIQNDRIGVSRNLAPIDPGVWHDYELHVKWSRDATVGFQELSRDGVPLGGVNFANIVNNESNYMKTGIYRDSQSGRHVAWHDGLVVYER